MGSSLTASTLTVTHTESISINGVEYGGTNTMTIASVAEVSKRIVNVPITEQTILSFSDKIAAGTFVEGDVKYIRITNKDDTHHVHLVFKNEFNHEHCIKLDKGQSFIYNGDLSAGVVDTFISNQLALGFTDATCDSSSDPTVTCDASKQIVPGLRVSGTNVPSGATVISVDTPGAVTSFELSGATTGTISNGTFTFTSGFGDLVEITAEANTAACDLEIFVANT